jgi:hypothetical protein
LRTDVAKGQTQIVFVHDVRRDFTVDNLGENGQFGALRPKA